MPQCRVSQPDPAEVERRRDHLVPERIERRRDPELDPGRGVPGDQVAELDELERVDGLARDPEACPTARTSRPAAGTRTTRARAHPLEPVALDRRARGGAVAVEPALDVVVARLARRPERTRAGSRAGTSRAASAACRPPRRAARRARAARCDAGRRRSIVGSSLTCQSSARRRGSARARPAPASRGARPLRRAAPAVLVVLVIRASAPSRLARRRGTASTSDARRRLETKRLGELDGAPSSPVSSRSSRAAASANDSPSSTPPAIRASTRRCSATGARRGTPRRGARR